jgi:hypothetical protein
MQPKLDKYLSDVGSYLEPLPTHIRQGELDEMAAHLHQLQADFVSRGHTTEEAEAMATARFGSARRAGLRLRDVWEGNRGAFVSFFAVLVTNYVLFAVNMVAGALGFTIPLLHNAALAPALEPVFVCWLCWTVCVMPFALNFALGRWAGRRAVLCALLIYVFVWDFNVNTGVSTSIFNLPSVLAHMPLFMKLMTISATLGAHCGSASRRRNRLALVAGAPLGTAPSLLIEHRRHSRGLKLRRFGVAAVALGVAGFAAYSTVRARVNDVLHPPTPEAAVRVMLSKPHWNPGTMEASTNVVVRALPATEAERKKNERRVFFTATMHATESYRKRRITFLQKNLQRSLAGHDVYGANSSRAALARLKPGGYTLSRTVRVRQTKQGWRVESEVRGGVDDTFAPWDWLEDVSYEER